MAVGLQITYDGLSPSARVLGVGPGLFVVIFFGIIAVVLSIVFFRTEYFVSVCLISALVVFIIWVSIYASPKAEGAPSNSTTDAPKLYDSGRVYRVLWMVLWIVVTLLSLLAVFLVEGLQKKQAKPIEFVAAFSASDRFKAE
eukprot:tig00020537_g10248.t1